MRGNRCHLANKPTVKTAWKKAREAGVRFEYESTKHKLFVNYDDLKTVGTLAEIKEIRDQLEQEIESYRPEITEIMRQESVLKDVLEIIDDLRTSGIRPVHCDLLNQCYQGLKSEHDSFAD